MYFVLNEDIHACMVRFMALLPKQYEQSMNQISPFKGRPRSYDTYCTTLLTNKFHHLYGR